MLRSPRILFWLGLLCCAIAFIPVYQHKEIPEGSEIRLRIGVPGSPWLDGQWMHTESTVHDGERTVHSQSGGYSFNFNVLTWSMGAVVAGVVMLVASRRLKAKTVE